jgi:hypothetical protein
VYIAKVPFRTGCKILSANTHAQPKGSELAPCVALVLLAVYSRVLRERDIRIFCKIPRSQPEIFGLIL